jgi:Zn-dependent M16 (insulinase) family peptidase
MPDILDGYEVLTSKPLPRIDGHLNDLIHKETKARHVHLTVPDRNSYFFAGYRTLPSDSTGVAHIMEHCVSGGSRRFPPGAGNDLYTRSLVTDLNATTHSDFTNFYFASRNRTDFMNWSEYVSDVSLYPRMEEDTFLRQRGHLAFNIVDDPTSGLKFVGVIFNEQKAVFANPTRHAFRALSRALFPGHPYSHDAGGDHTEVPKLTYEGIMEFNRRFYHPANAFFVSRGNLPLEVILEKVGEIIGPDYRKGDPVEIPSITPLDEPVVVEAPFPVGAGEEGAAGQFVLGWVTLPGADSYARLLFQVGVESLMEGPTAPLRRAIEDSGLVGGLIRPMVAPYRNIMVALYLTGVDAANAGRLESLVLDTLSDVAAKGLDPGLVDAAITRLELRRREQREALGIFLDTVMPPILYGGDPYPALELDSNLDRLAKERKSERPLEELITSQLVENPHRARVAVVPDAGFEQRVRAAEAKWLAEEEAKLTDEDRSRMVERGKRLSVRPEEPFEKRGLTPNEGFVELETPTGETTEVSGVSVDAYATATGGITYLGMRIDASGIADDSLDYLGLFASLLARRARVASAGVDVLNVVNHLRVDPSGERTLHWLELNARALDRDQTQLAELVQELATGFELDPKMLRQQIAESASALEQSLMPEAQVHLRRLAGGALRRSSQIDDRIRGIGQLKFLKDLAGADNSKVAEKLRSITDELLVRNRMALCVTGADPHGIVASFGDGLSSISSGSAAAAPASDLLADGARPHRARVTQLPVAFTCEAHSIPGLDHPEGPAVAVLAHLIWFGYLNGESRKVGAYGIDVQALPERGLFWMSSRRDPLPGSTYRSFIEGISRFREGRWEGPKAEDGKLAALRVTDPVDSPATAARRAWLGKFTGHTVGAWNTFRRRILDVTDEDLRRVAEEHLSAGARATLTGPNMLEESREESKLFDEVVEV